VTKPETIAQCVIAIADYYEVKSSDILTTKNKRCARIANARAMLVLHMFRSGMNCEQISKVIHVNKNTVMSRVTRAQQMMMGPNKDLMDVLPKIIN
jgi:ribosomal protein S27AE